MSGAHSRLRRSGHVSAIIYMCIDRYLYLSFFKQPGAFGCIWKLNHQHVGFGVLVVGAAWQNPDAVVHVKGRARVKLERALVREEVLEALKFDGMRAARLFISLGCFLSRAFSFSSSLTLSPFLSRLFFVFF